MLGIGITVVTIGPIISPVIEIGKLFILDSKYDFSESGQDLLSDITSIDASQETVKLSEITIPSYGDRYGHMTIDNTQVDVDVYFGDGQRELHYGVGTYSEAGIPGQNKTILMGAHTSTHFADLKSVQVGSIIHIQTNYGIYQYRITDAKVGHMNDTSMYDLSKEYENIILYTCYPFGSVGMTDYRYFVYGEYVSGPMIVEG